MSLNYTKKTIRHFLKPKNIGEIKNPDAVAEIGNMVCGDQLSFSLKIKDGKIKDIKFLSFGCASNIATASIMTEKVKGMSVAQAKKFNWQSIVAELGGLPQQKVHCSMMAIEGLRKVLSEYESNHPVSAIKKPSRNLSKNLVKKVKKSV